MTFVAPTIPAVGDLITAAQASVIATDLTEFSPSAFTEWTPAWQQSDGTMLSIGNGTMTGRYQRINRTITAEVVLTRGSTTNVGTENYQWILPVAASNNGWSGTGIVRQVTPTTDITCVARLITTTLVVLGRTDTFARIAYDNPGTWDTGDIIQWTLTYEAAT